jgi:L-alanine-DL-glutamate epimerase-like enolase superfamily enzyme
MMTRRHFMAGAAAFMAVPASTDTKIDELRISFEDFLYRAPYMFGGREVDRVTMLNVHCRLSTRAGKSASGFASMSMGNVWAFPDREIGYDGTLEAMKRLGRRIEAITRDFTGYAHPLDVSHTLEPEYLKAADEVARDMKLPRPIPKLCTQVTASPIDAALYDAFGKIHGRSAFAVAGKDFVKNDLAHYLGKEFSGEYLDSYIQAKPTPRIRMYHSVGASDPLTAAELKTRINDGLPETFEEWIPYSGVTAVKIKLNGGNLAADVDRVVAIDRVTEIAQAKRGFKDWIYCLDFNEGCPNVKYVLDFEEQVQAKAPAVFSRVQYIEQPTARDLRANRGNTMFEAAKMAPVVIDESLTDLETLLLARDMGYTGAALKACKGQSHTLLMAAATQKYKMFRCVQDLTCPGAALIHSAAVAAYIPGITTLEANARQYVPVANKDWVKKYPGIFDIRNGYLDTSVLDVPGLGTS